MHIYMECCVGCSQSLKLSLIVYIHLNKIFQHRLPWWRHQTSSALLALCAGNSLVTGEFPSQRPVTRSFDGFFDLRLNKRLSKQSWGWWFETPSRPLWRHCNVGTGMARRAMQKFDFYIESIYDIADTMAILQTKRLSLTISVMRCSVFYGEYSIKLRETHHSMSRIFDYLLITWVRSLDPLHSN